VDGDRERVRPAALSVQPDMTGPGPRDEHCHQVVRAIAGKPIRCCLPGSCRSRWSGLASHSSAPPWPALALIPRFRTPGPLQCTSATMRLPRPASSRVRMAQRSARLAMAPPHRTRPDQVQTVSTMLLGAPARWCGTPISCASACAPRTKSASRARPLRHFPHVPMRTSLALSYRKICLSYRRLRRASNRR
jgi:hypothetical protein